MALNVQASDHTYIRNTSQFVLCRGHISDITTFFGARVTFYYQVVPTTLCVRHIWRWKASFWRIRLSYTVKSISFHPTDEQICIGGAMQESYTVREKRAVTTAGFAPNFASRAAIFYYAPISNLKRCKIVITQCDDGLISVLGCRWPWSWLKENDIYTPPGTWLF